MRGIGIKQITAMITAIISTSLLGLPVFAFSPETGDEQTALLLPIMIGLLVVSVILVVVYVVLSKKKKK